MNTISKEPLPTRESLLGRLKDWDDQRSWQDFNDTYKPLIYAVALKSGLSPAEADDAVQETLVAVASKIKEFKYDPALGSFKGWLLTLTRWRIADQYRKRQRHVQGRANETSKTDETRKTDLLERVPDPASLEIPDRLWDAEWKSNLTARASECVREKVEPRTFQMFQLYVLKDWPVSRVAKTLGVSCTQVYVAKHRVSALLRKEIKRLERMKF